MVIQKTWVFAEVFCVLLMKTDTNEQDYVITQLKNVFWFFSGPKLMLTSGEKKVVTLLLGIHMETSVRTAI